MKKTLLALFIVVILAWGVYPLQTTGTLNVSVLVQGSFNLTVNSDSFDFAQMVPGTTGEINRADGIKVAGTSSNGNPWYLSISALKPLSSGSDFISNDNFSWYGSSEGNGEWLGSAPNDLSKASTAYIASVDESDAAVKVMSDFWFKLFVPKNTKPGNYTTTVMFTMTE